jgi:hypothetical protein
MTIDGIPERSNHCLTGTGWPVQHKRALLPGVLLVIAGILGVLAVAKVTGFFIASARAQRIVRQAAEWNKPDTSAVESQTARFRLIAEDLKKKNIFWPSPPKEHPIKAVLGIFGDEAYIDGKWYKAGDKIADAKIIAIDAASVTTEWDGKKTVFQPIDAETSPAPGGPQSGPERPGPKPGPPGPERPDRAVQPGMPPMRGPEGGRPGVGGEGQPSEEDMARMKEEMEKAKEQ